MVVRHRDDEIELARLRRGVAGAHEHGVRRVRAAGRDAGSTRLRDGRCDQVDLLVAEQPALACMRVQAGHRDARRGQAEAQPRGMRDGQRVDDALGRQRVDRPPQRQVDRHQHHAQLVVGQHHAHRRHRLVRHGGQRLQHLGVARKRDAGGRQRLLVDRRRDDRASGALLHPCHGLLDAAGGGGTGARRDRAERQLGQAMSQAGRLADSQRAGGACGAVGRMRQGRYRQRQSAGRGGTPQHAHVADHHRIVELARRGGPGDDLRADAARVAHRDEQRQGDGDVVRGHRKIVPRPRRVPHSSLPLPTATP